MTSTPHTMRAQMSPFIMQDPTSGLESVHQLDRQNLDISGMSSLKNGQSQNIGNSLPNFNYNGTDTSPITNVPK